MFTGIVGEIGTVMDASIFGKGRRLTIEAPRYIVEIGVGDSIAINGVCLTVVETSGADFLVEAVEETLKKTNIGLLEKGHFVNLELPLRVGDRLGGHYVLGHADETTRVRKIEPREESWWVGFELAAAQSRFIIPRGSVCIDGVSLTVAEKEHTAYYVSIIPFTHENTLFRTYSPGSLVNVEYDVLGKYALNVLDP